MQYFRRSAAAATLAAAAFTSMVAGGPAFAQPVPASPAPGMTPLPAPTPLGGPMMTPAPAMTPAMVTPAPAVTPTSMASPGSSPSPMADAANPPENPLITARVRREFLAWQRGRIDRSTYSPTAGGTYLDAYVQVVRPDLAIGAVQTVSYRTASLLLGDICYRYDVSAENGMVSVLYALDGRGKTDGIVFTPEVFRAATATP